MVNATAIEAHLKAHEKKIARKRKARLATAHRKKWRGLRAAIARMQ